MIKKILLFFLIVVVFTCFVNINNVNACDNIISGADKFVNNCVARSETAINSGGLKDLSDSLYNVLLVVGICIAVIVGAILGIQFMAGSVEQKAKVKDSLIPFVVGCVIIFGAFGIWKLIITILK